MHTKDAARVSVALLAICTAVSAWADVSSTATISGLQIQAVDLDANDGIAASVAFGTGNYNDTWTYSGAADFAPTFNGNVPANVSQFAVAPQYSPVSTSADYGGGHASTSSVGDVFGAGLTMTAATSAQTDLPNGTFGDAYVRPNGYGFETLYVAPHTEVVITGSFDILNTGTGVVGEGWQTAVAVRLHDTAVGGYLGDQGERSGTFTLTFDNFSDVQATERLDSYVQARSFTVQNVPEPASAAMLLAGLGLLGLGRRRQIVRRAV